MGRSTKMSGNVFVLAEFDSPQSLYKAAKKVRDKGIKAFDVFSPFPIHGMDDAMGLKPSILPWLSLTGGIIGLTVGFCLQAWVATTAYPLVISGKPLFSYQAFVPVTFELMVLIAAFFTVFGMFKLNGLPQPYHPLFKSKNFTKVTTDGFFLAIESENVEETTQFIETLGGTNVESIKND